MIRSEIVDSILVVTPDSRSNLGDIVEFISKNINAWVNIDILWDTSAINFADITGDMLKQAVSQIDDIDKIRPGRKTAIFAKSSLQYGMMRVLESYADNTEMEVDLKIFWSKREAISWLKG